MLPFLNQLFNVRTGEWRRMLYLYAMYLVFMIGLVWGGAVVQATFLTQVGLRYLPVAFVVEAIVTMIAVFVYNIYVDRIPNDHMLIIVLLVSAAAVFVGLVFLGLDLVTIAIPLLYLLYLVIGSTFPLQWWNYIDEFYDTITAKRIVPIIASALQVGSVIGGATLPFLNSAISTDNVIILWLLTLLLVAYLTWLLPRVLKNDEAAQHIQARITAAIPPWQSLKEGYSYIAHSSFLRWMSANTLFLTILMALIGYQTDKILLTELETTENLSNFIGALQAIVNFVMLPIQIFVFSRIVGRLGVQDTNLIFPFGSMLVAGMLVGAPSLIAVGAMGVFDRTAFRKTFQNPVEILMYNTIPLRVKGRVGATIAGGFQPLGTLIGGVLLIVLLPVIGSGLEMAILLVGLSFVYFAISIILRREYTSALLQTLEEEDFSFLLDPPTAVNIVDSTTLRFLEKRLHEEGASDELKLFIAQLITQVGGNECVPILRGLFYDGSERLRRGLVDLLVSAEIRSEEIGRLYLQLVEDPDPQIRRSALAGLEWLLSGENIRFLNLALRILKEDDSLVVKVQVMPVLIRSGDIFYMGTAFQYLSYLLSHADAENRISAIQVLQQIDDARLVRNLLDVLQDKNDEVRLAAALAVERLSAFEIPEWMYESVREVSKPLLSDSVERIREAAININASMKDEQSFRDIIATLRDPSPQIRRHAVMTLSNANGYAQGTVVPVLIQSISTDEGISRYGAVALAKIQPEQHRNRVLTFALENIAVIYANYGRLAVLEAHEDNHPGVAILADFYRGQSKKLLDELYYFLANAYDKYAVQRIRLAMPNADNRPFAVEAVEALTSNARLATLLSQLYEDMDSWSLHNTFLDVQHGTLDTGKHRIPPPVDKVLNEIIENTNDDWLYAVVIYTVGELHEHIGEDERERVMMRARAHRSEEVRGAVDAAQRAMQSEITFEIGGDMALSNLEKIIFLKQVPLFVGLSIEELKLLASICEEVVYEKGQRIFNEGDPGDAMYIIVNGRVSVEIVQHDGKVTRLATRTGYEFFGEMALFDAGPRSAAIVTIVDTLLLKIEGTALMKLARQYPDLAIDLIRVLSGRLRDAMQQVAKLDKGKDRRLVDVFDRLEF